MRRGYYQVSASDCSAQLSCRESSEGPHVRGYADSLLFIFRLRTLAKTEITLFVIFALRPNVGPGGVGPAPFFPRSVCFLADDECIFRRRRRRRRKQHFKEYRSSSQLIGNTENSNPGKKKSQIQIFCRNYRANGKDLDSEKCVFIVINTLSLIYPLYFIFELCKNAKKWWVMADFAFSRMILMSLHLRSSVQTGLHRLSLLVFPCTLFCTFSLFLSQTHFDISLPSSVC